MPRPDFVWTGADKADLNDGAVISAVAKAADAPDNWPNYYVVMEFVARNGSFQTVMHLMNGVGYYLVNKATVPNLMYPK